MSRKIFAVLFSVVLVLSFSLVTAMPAGAQLDGTTWYVATTGNNSNDGLSWATAWRDIGYALDQASGGDTINVAAGTYTENINLVDGVEVLGAGAGASIIDGDDSGTVVTANSVGSGTKLDGFTITNGNAYAGGGMRNQYSSSPVVSNCTFYYNSATYGGGMWNCGSYPTVSNCTFDTNTATGNGGGMYNSDSSSPVVTNCTFSGNSAIPGPGGYGGGMYNVTNSSPEVSNCTFYDNEASNGGGMYNTNSSPTVTNCTFDTNTATNYGGGMFNNYYSSPVVTNCTFSGNPANYGGGMCNINSSPTVSRCTFSDNEDTEYGGGMYNYDCVSSPEVTKCAFSGNEATEYGGGMFNESSLTEVASCTFYDNEAGYGGGMYNYDSSAEVTSCAFYDNEADYYGGGMYNYDSSTEVINCTFSGNTATTNGGGMYNYDCDSSLVVTNCILWDDNGGEIVNGYSGTPYPPLPVVTYCDIEGGYTGTGNIDADPLFVGGGDLHLTPGSPCIDAGSDAAVPVGITTDFEGDPRIVDGDTNGLARVDMGADEYAQTDVWVNGDWAEASAGEEVDTGKFFGYNAFTSINAGVAAVANGGTVYVYPGTYDEPTTVIDKSLTLVSTDSPDWHETVIDNYPDAEIAFASNFTGVATISGFTISHGTYGIYINGLDGGTVTVNNCLIYGNGTGIYGCGTLDGSIFIDNCIIADNGFTTGIHLSTIAGTVEITDSVIGAYYDTETEITYLGNAGDGIAIDSIAETGNVLIDNSKIVNNTGNGICVGGSWTVYGQLTITNNVIGAYDYDLVDSEAGDFDGNGSNGISIDHVGETGVVTIEGNWIAQNWYGIYFAGEETIVGEVIIDNNYIGAWTEYTTVGDVLYSYSFTGNYWKGIAVGNVASDSSLVIVNNKIAENSYGVFNETGLYISTTSGDVVIAANYIGAWTEDIPGGDPVSYGGNGGPGIRINYVAGGSLLILGNTVAENTAAAEPGSGIYIDAAEEDADISVNLNNILDNDDEGVYYGGGEGYLEEIDATNNWWGNASGPGGEGPGTGDEVSEHVDYEPWLEVSVADAKAGAITDGKLDAMDEADTEVIVDGSAVVTVARYSDNPGGDAPGRFESLGKYIDVHVDSATPGTEIEIRSYYTLEDIAGLTEGTLRLFWWDGTSWVECSDSDVTHPAGGPTYRGYIWAKIRADTTPSLDDLVGSPFGLMGALAAAGSSGGVKMGAKAPVISDVECADCTETSITLRWSTDKLSTSRVEYWVSQHMFSPLDESLVTSHEVELTNLQPCTVYHFRVISADHSGNEAISEEGTCATLGEANFTSSDLSISPGEVDIGQSVTISALVTNTGSCSGSYTVTLKINDVVEATREVTLDAGASESVTFTVSKEEAGIYSVVIDGLSGSFTVTASVASQPSSPAGASSQGASLPPGASSGEEPLVNNWAMFSGIIAAAVVVVGLAILFVVKRRTGRSLYLWVR